MQKDLVKQHRQAWKTISYSFDGKIISVPVIRDTIASGSGQISGGFTFQSQ